MKKVIILSTIFVFVAVGWISARRRQYKYTSSNAAWMTISSSKKKSLNYYLDISKNGDIVYRTESKNKIITKKGSVPRQIAKDFFREAKNSESAVAEQSKTTKLIFYKGEILKISFYLSGELRRIIAPLVNFGEGFSYAFNQIQKLSKELTLDKKTVAFISAQPLVDELLDEFRKDAGKDYKFKLIETNTLRKTEPLLNAIKQPHRLVPLKSKKELNAIRQLTRKEKLYGLRTLFYISTTRGKFKCFVLNAR
ncbi:MAG: hypothetical protein U9Q34_02170 [Elusimicrobiota bacterium]|nr:hypothetical protein [Elusimicrobiota bacterium]